MATSANERLATEQDGISHRVARRDANRRHRPRPAPTADAQGLVELSCECIEGGLRAAREGAALRLSADARADQYLLQAGHHAFAQYRTIISVGLMRIEERI